MLNFLHIFSHILSKNPRHHFIPLTWQFPDFIGFSYLMPFWSLDICDKLKGLHFGFSTGINVCSWLRTLLPEISPPPSLLLTELGSQQLPCSAQGWSRDDFLGFPLVETRQGQGQGRDRKWLLPGTAIKLQEQFQCFPHNLSKIRPL